MHRVFKLPLTLSEWIPKELGHELVSSTDVCMQLCTDYYM